MLELANTKRKVLEEYTKIKTTKALEIAVERKRSDELAKKAAWELEMSTARKLERQIVFCQIKAPSDGLLVYANDPGRAVGRNQAQIEEGATVRERQKIFSIPDISKMQMNAKVSESQIDKVAPGMKARVRVDAFADRVLTATVHDVAPLPDPTNFFSQDIKVYTTHLAIDEPVPGLRPGMSAQGEILVYQAENVLSVPIQALIFDGEDRVAVKKPGGGFDWREVTLGKADEEFVEVKEGLQSGDFVIVEPLSLMSETEKRERLKKRTRHVSPAQNR